MPEQYEPRIKYSNPNDSSFQDFRFWIGDDFLADVGVLETDSSDGTEGSTDGLTQLTKRSVAFYTTFDQDEFEISFHAQFKDTEEAGPSVRRADPSTNGVDIRFPVRLARVAGLISHANEHNPSAIVENIDAEDHSFDIRFSPPLFPTGVNDDLHPTLSEQFKESGVAPAKYKDNRITALRYEFPVEYAREYGYEPQQKVGIHLTQHEGQLAIAIDYSDTEGPDRATQSLNSYTDEGPRRDLYNVSIPKVLFHSLRWGYDLSVRAIPFKTHTVLVPASPIVEIDGIVADDDILADLGPEQADT